MFVHLVTLFTCFLETLDILDQETREIRKRICKNVLVIRGLLSADFAHAIQSGKPKSTKDAFDWIGKFEVVFSNPDLEFPNKTWPSCS